jgi:hypothetical protein
MVQQHNGTVVVKTFLLLSLLATAGEDNKELWKAHDATELVKAYSGPALPTLVDTGRSCRGSSSSSVMWQ